MRRMRLVTVLVAAAAGVSAATAGAPTDEAASAVSRYRLDERGRVGELRLDSARMSAVRRLFGRGRLTKEAEYTALGYDCRVTDCLTSFYFNDGRLSDVQVLRDRRFRTRRGTRVGMTFREARRRERRKYEGGCPGGIIRSTRRATLTISVAFDPPGSSRGRVDQLILSSRRRSVLSC